MNEVLLVETDPDLRRAMTASLEQEGWRVFQAGTAEAAGRVLERRAPWVLVLEHDPPRAGAGKIIDLYRRRRPSAGVILLTAADRPGDAWRRTYQPDAVIYKPFDVRYLGRRIRELVAVAAETAPDIHTPDQARRLDSANLRLKEV